MALTLGDNFSYQGAKPLDARLKYADLATMKAVADATMYEGCMAYCEATGRTYQWKSSNTVDATLGKWREYGVEEMPSEDMADVITPLPSARPAYHKYSTEEQIVGEWIGGSTLYEKVISGLAMPQVTTTSEILKYSLSSYGIPSDATVVAYDVYITNDVNVYKRCHFANAVDADYSIMLCNSWFTNDPTIGRQFAVRNNTSTYNDYLITVIVQYTKNT